MNAVDALLVTVALAAGMLLGLNLGRRSAARPRRLAGVAPAQLLRWLQEAPGGWLLLDAGDMVRLINTRAERLLQVPGAALLRRPSLLDVCAAPELPAVIATARRRRRPQRFDWQAGDEEVEMHILPGDQGWVAVALQSRRSLEAQLDQQSRWVGDVAHELKTPLTALLLVGDSLAARVNSQNAVLVERLQRELLRLQALVNDLLELSRLENTLPGDGLRREPLDPLDLVKQVWSGLRPLAQERGIALRLILRPEGQPPPTLQADRSRLHRALYNLLDNAIRYSPDEALVEVRLESGAAWCLLGVRDQGPGLSDEDLAHLFERFWRGDPSRARSRRAGSGLGLAIVQQIALTHGGRVQASNHPEGGALLEVLLPLSR